MEAQACYSLGNTYTLLQDYERAAEYHLRHLVIAQELADRCVKTRPWLGLAYSDSLGLSTCSPAGHTMHARSDLPHRPSANPSVGKGPVTFQLWNSLLCRSGCSRVSEPQTWGQL